MASTQRPARLGFLLSQLGAYAADLFAEQTRALGVTPAEAGLIRLVARRPATAQAQLADELGTTPSRIVALIDGLERKKLAIRTRSATDRRVQLVDLTDQGRALMPMLRAAAEAQEAAVTEGLSEHKRETLRKLLVELTDLRGLSAEVHTGYAAGA